MATRGRALRVLIATDGSAQARAALRTAVQFPWPAQTQVRVVVARRTGAEYRRSILLSALDRNAEAIAARARRVLSPRWPEVEAIVVDKAPVEGVLDEATRYEPDVIVTGWRGHGAVRRLLMGSVSRGILRGSSCTVLVVRREVRVRTIVVGFDGSPTAQRAVAFVARLVPPAGGRVVLVTAVDVVAAPSRRLAGAAGVAREVKRTNAERERLAMRNLDRVAARLRRAGWQTRTVVTTGEPLRDLLGTIGGTRPQLLVVGARGSSGIRHLILGSVAEGAVNRSAVPVLVVR